MKSLLIKDTTVSERAQIVSQALGADSDCEDVDFSDMYDDYITKALSLLFLFFLLPFFYKQLGSIL